MIYIGLLDRMICICARYEVDRDTLSAASMYPKKIRATSPTQVCQDESSQTSFLAISDSNFAPYLHLCIRNTPSWVN